MALSTEEVEAQLSQLCCSGTGVSPIGEQFFRFLALSLLVNIADGIEGSSSSSSDVVWIPAEIVAFGDLTNVHQIFLNDTNDKLDVEIRNDTDAALWISFDDSTDHQYIGAGDIKHFIPGSQGARINTEVSLRHETGAAPTIGQVVITAYYRA